MSPSNYIKIAIRIEQNADKLFLFVTSIFFDKYDQQRVEILDNLAVLLLFYIQITAKNIILPGISERKRDIIAYNFIVNVSFIFDNFFFNFGILA